MSIAAIVQTEEYPRPVEDGSATLASPLQCHQYRIRQQQATIEQCPDIDFNLKRSLIREVPIAQIKPIILRYEWLGTMPGFSACAYGHFFSGVLGGVALLGYTGGSDKAFTRMFPGKKVIVLQRGVHLWWTPPNAASWFISKVCLFLRKKGFDIITATADHEAGEVGTIYQALNWAYVGRKKHGHPVFIVNGKEIHPKTLYDRHGTSATAKIQELYGNALTIKPRQFKHRYVYALDRTIVIPSLLYLKRRIS